MMVNGAVGNSLECREYFEEMKGYVLYIMTEEGLLTEVIYFFFGIEKMVIIV